MLFAFGIAVVLAAIFVGAVMVGGESDAIGAQALGVVGLGVLVAALVLVRWTVVTPDRRQRLVTIRQAGVLRRSATEIPLASVLGAEIQSRRPFFDRRTRQVHRPALLLIDGTAHPLTTLHGFSPGAGHVVAAIRRWLESSRSAG